jgi:membrane-anchored mycosin MYCP
MSRNGFRALGALVSACGLVTVAGGAAGAAPALAAATSPAARAPLAAALAGVPVPQPVTPSNATQNNGCQENPPSITANTARLTSTPWAQTALDFEDVWRLGDEGQGVTVGVIDSGIDYNSQLAGRVSAIDVTGSGIQDCVGHGTAVAGIIAASDQVNTTGNPFTGVAPDANILSVKVADADSTNSNDPQLTGDAVTLSEGIVDAVERGATVLNISIVSSNSPELAAAVQFAEDHNVVVVAAGGNDFAGGPTGPFYPASYPGVISVGPLDSDGSLSDFADSKTLESVTAPGDTVTSIEPNGFNDLLQGTSFATPFVAGVAALVRAFYPTMSAAQVVARIEATADGPTTSITGNGMVNPLQAVQAVLPFSANPDASPTPANLQPFPVSRPVPPDQGTIDAAMWTTVGAITAAALVAIGGVVITQARRRRRGQETKAPEPPVPADAGLADSPLW